MYSQLGWFPRDEALGIAGPVFLQTGSSLCDQAGSFEAPKVKIFMQVNSVMLELGTIVERVT